MLSAELSWIDFWPLQVGVFLGGKPSKGRSLGARVVERSSEARPVGFYDGAPSRRHSLRFESLTPMS